MAGRRMNQGFAGCSPPCRTAARMGSDTGRKGRWRWARQPCSDKSGARWITFDGRLDNRRELAHALGDDLPGSQTASDASYALAAYERWGERCPEQLLGDFAFVVWDGRRHQMFGARDPVGMRPFYYARTAEGFFAASEIASLLAVSGSTRPNPGMLAEYLSGRVVTTTDTLHQDIVRLPAGHRLIVSDGGIRRERYYTVDPSAQVRHRTDADYVEQFLAIFREAVACRLRGHTAVGVTVSGGLDSSAVLGMAHRLMGPHACAGLAAYALTFTHPAADERVYLNDVVAKWPGRSRIVPGEAWTGPTTTAQCGTRPDFPDLPNGAPWRTLYDAARRDGARVMLGGGGGDEWLGGSWCHQADLLRKLDLRALWKECTEIGWSFDHAVVPLIPQSIKRLARRAMPERIPAWIDPAWARRAGLRERWRHRPELAALATHAQRDISSTLTDGWTALQHELCDRLHAESGLERREPFHDRRLIEFALALPEDQRRRGHETKYVLRQTGDALLPESVRTRRTKAEFSHLYTAAIAREDPESRLGSLRLVEEGYLSRDGVRSLWRDSRSGSIGPLHMWMVLATESWYRRCFA
jgi:asparagine synthase (glutamine-hydrolysing)